MPLDIEQPEQLIDYLRSTGRIAANETPQTQVLAGGVSNRTVLVERASGEAWVMKQALAKLRTKIDWYSDPARIHREALGLKYLEQLAPPGSITPLIFEDQQNYILAMRAVPRPHENWKTMLLAGRVETTHVEQFATILSRIHGASERRGDELKSAFGDQAFFRSLRIEPFYQYTAGRIVESKAFYADLIEESLARRVSLVHGDFSPKNVLVRAGTLVLLDHEVIHWGDPAFDVGFAAAHLLSKAHHLPGHRAAFSDAASTFWRTYGKSLGAVSWSDAHAKLASRHALGCLLARVAGRSPLEYLSEQERERQHAVVVDLMRSPPADLQATIDEFIRGISHAGD